MINIGRPNTGYVPPAPNVTQSTLAPLGSAVGGMGQLKSSLVYRQSDREGQERMERNLEAGRPVGVYDVDRYERDLKNLRAVAAASRGSTMGATPRFDSGTSFLANAKKNFETNVY